MKRWFALLLALVMTLLLVPTAFAAGSTEAGADIWDQIAAIEANAVKSKGTVDLETRTRAYEGAVDQIAAAVEASADYVPGSLIRNGDVLFWDTVDGQGCGYSPRLRARVAETAIPDADPEAYSGVETVSYATRGGWPGSIDVAVFQPYYGIDSSFTTQYADEGQSIAQATGGTSTTYLTTSATIDSIADAFETCGVVIFDSHGDTDYANGSDYTSQANTSYLLLQSGTGITTADQVTVQGPYSTYKHAYYAGSYGSMKYYCVDGTAIANHMTQDSPNGLLWAAICLGMATDGLHAPLRAKGLEVAYGYSQSVTFTGDYKWEEYFWEKMKAGEDVKTAIAYMKQKVGIKDPYTSDYPAYPIVVSSEDAYPGHGNVDKAQTVYSTWTLFSQYEITALSNNEAWGTVSVSGRTITATPATGYYVAGYEVTAGTAAVTQNGNIFDVRAESDCTVRINFAPRTPAQVLFSVPEGVSCGNISGYIGDVITLPSPQGAPVNGAMDFHFLGWTAEQLDESSEAPAFLSAGETMELTESSVTLYALYGFFTDGDGAEGQFLKLSAAPEDWAGEYLITYNGSKILNAAVPEGSSASYMGTSKAVTDISDTPIISIDYYLSLVPDGLVFVIEPDATGAYPGTYTVKMKGEDRYLAVTTNSNTLSTKTTATDGATHWRLSVENGSPVVTNVGFPTRTLQFNPTAGVFRGYLAGAYEPITLYSAQEGSLWFTTDPNAISACEEHVFGDWTVETEPTCTEPGVRCHVCEQCGLKEREEIPALGHDFVDGVCTRCGAEDPVPTVKVTNVPATGKVKLTWTAVDGAVSYNVYRAFSADGAFSLLQNTTDLSFTHTGGKPNKRYYYKVAAVYSDREGAMSETVNRMCDVAQPKISVSHDAASGKNKVTWKAVDGASSYMVYCEELGGWIGSTTELSFIHADGVPGSKYTYRVMASAKYTAANSAFSAPKSLTCDLPQPVVSRDHVAATGKNVLSWAAVDGAVSYRLYCAETREGTYKLLRTMTDTKFIHNAAVAGKTYYYKVVAVAANTEANSAYSEIKALTCDLPRPEVSITLSSGGNPKLTWAAVDGTISYRIYRATSAGGTFDLYYTTENVTFINSNVEKGRTYYYKVVAVAANIEANSAYSSVVSIKAGK